MPLKWILPLDGLRGVAAITVLVGHAGLQIGYPGKIAPSLGVALFFALSGFLMGHLYIEMRASPSNVARYVIARFARVYPLFAVVVLCAMISRMNGYPTAFNMPLSEVAPLLQLRGSAITLWTISVEFQFYAVFIVLWIFRDRWRGSKLVGLALISAAAIAMAIYFTGTQGRIAIGRYMHLFVFGIFAALLLPRMARFVRAAAWCMPLFFLLYIASLVVVPRLYHADLIYGDPVIWVICVGLVVSAALANNSPFGRLLSWGPIRYLGAISFGIYLLHRPVLVVMDRMQMEHGIALLPVALALTIAVASLAHFVIERPARKFIRRAGDQAIDYCTSMARRRSFNV